VKKIIQGVPEKLHPFLREKFRTVRCKMKFFFAPTSAEHRPIFKQESPADARVARDSSACIPPSWIFEISTLHH